MKPPVLILLTVLLVGPSLFASEADVMSNPSDLVSFDHQAPSVWRTVNDGVMGGVSSSSMQTSGQDTGLFTGSLSLDYNGGFASVRTTPARHDLSAWQGLELRVRGDGRTYQVRLRTNDDFDGVAYRAMLPKVEAEWTTVRLPFSTFLPTFRGRVLRDVPPLDRGDIRQLTLMIADKEAGPFRLEVTAITTYGEADPTDEAPSTPSCPTAASR